MVFKGIGGKRTGYEDGDSSLGTASPDARGNRVWYLSSRLGVLLTCLAGGGGGNRSPSLASPLPLTSVLNRLLRPLMPEVRLPLRMPQEEDWPGLFLGD